MNSHHLKPINVLLVDEYRTVLWGLEQLVASASPAMAICGMATNIADMFANVAGDAVDVILLDLKLVIEDSFRCLERLNRECSAKVLVISGTSNLEVDQQAILRGARGIVYKKQSPELILRAIEKVSEGEIWLDRVNLTRAVTALANGKAIDPQAEKIAKLTPKERQIVSAVVKEKGARGKVVAEKLHISEHTFRNHMTTIYKKLEVSGRMELYLYASHQTQIAA